MRLIALMCGAISWRIAIATPSMYLPGMSCSGVAFGFFVADDVIILYPFSRSLGLWGCVFLG